MKLDKLHESFEPGVVADWMRALKRLRKTMYRHFKGLKTYVTRMKASGTMSPQELLKHYGDRPMYLHFTKEQVAHLLAPEGGDELAFHVDDRFGGTDYTQLEIGPEEIRITGADIDIPKEVQDALIDLTNNYRRHIYNIVTDEA